MRIAIAVALALAACKGKGKDAGKDQAAGKPAAPAQPQAGSAADRASTPGPDDGLPALSVRFSGKPIPMQRGLVKRMDPDRYQVYLTTGAGSCRELLDNVFETADRVDVLATVTPRLNADGKRYLQLSEVHEGAPTMVIAPGARVMIDGAAAAGERVEVVLDFAARAEQRDDKGLLIEVHGSFTAEGCGTRPPPPTGVPRAAHPTSATLTIANQRLELKGAIVRGTGKARDLVLSTTPRDCSPAAPWAQVTLERTRGRWRLAGTWLERAATAADPAGDRGLAAALGAAGSSEDGPTVAVALSGAGTLGGYAVALDGTIEAIACKP